MSRFFLGLDGGQSSTVALVADETGRVLGAGTGGPCDSEHFRQSMLESVQSAASNAGLAEKTKFTAACFGLSGGSTGREAILRELVAADHYAFHTDALIALTGALAGEPGVIAIAGTGSIAFGRNAAGTMARAGGWGYAFGDEGGAFDIVRQALRAALRDEEGWGAKTQLGEGLRKATGVERMNDLLHRFYTPEFPRAKIARYAKLVDQAAREGDATARDIMNAPRNRWQPSWRRCAGNCFIVAKMRAFPISGECSRAKWYESVFSCWWNWKAMRAFIHRRLVQRGAR